MPVWFASHWRIVGVVGSGSSFKMVDLDSWPSCLSAADVFGGMVLTSSKFVDTIPRSCDCRQPSTDGLHGASTMLNLTLGDLSLKETLKVVAPIFPISEPPYPL